MGEKKGIYRQRIARQLYFTPGLSCAELSNNIGKSLPVTTKLLNELIDEQMVQESGFAPSSGGRRPLTYSLASNIIYIVSVAMDQEVTRIAIMDVQNQVINTCGNYVLPMLDNTNLWEDLAELISLQIRDSGIPFDRLAGIGIGMPGFVDAKKGINHTFNKIGGKSISTFISERLGLPVFIDNDSSLIALAELRFGVARNSRNAMVVNIGWGIGLGMILNGQLFRGHNGFAGEFSHIPLFTNGKLCGCGKSGCLETETSLLVLVNKAREGLKAGRASNIKLTADSNYEEACTAILTAAQSGDRFAVELISEDGYNIGRGIAILIHILNPELIVLSGRGSSAGQIWQAPIQHALNEYSIPRLAASTHMEVSTLGDQAELIGAAALVVENLEHTNHFRSGSRKLAPEAI
ncbi:MAG TPA: ROK family protein [Flavitalea sp.]|nr:ROK family protein [Flavitalea sp.]